MKKIIPLLIFTLSTQSVLAYSPWFTGPMLASSGVTMPYQHTDLEFYAFDTHNQGNYNRFGKLTATPTEKTNQYLGVYYYGLYPNMDFELLFPYSFHYQQGQSGNGISDMTIALAFQAIETPSNSRIPNVRIAIAEVLPSGRYEQLNPSLLGTNVTGKGSYQTTVSFCFQQLYSISEYYLRPRVTINYTIPSKVTIQGFGAYGGNRETNGFVHLGQNYSIDAATELSITQHWVLAMEAYYYSERPTTFHGTTGASSPLTIGRGRGHELSLAPAFEYNFTSDVGLLLGYWFSVEGHNEGRFRSAVAALNIFF